MASATKPWRLSVVAFEFPIDASRSRTWCWLRLRLERNVAPAASQLPMPPHYWELIGLQSLVVPQAPQLKASPSTELSIAGRRARPRIGCQSLPGSNGAALFSVTSHRLAFRRTQALCITPKA